MEIIFFGGGCVVGLIVGLVVTSQLDAAPREHSIVWNDLVDRSNERMRRAQELVEEANVKLDRANQRYDEINARTEGGVGK